MDMKKNPIYCHEQKAENTLKLTLNVSTNKGLI